MDLLMEILQRHGAIVLFVVVIAEPLRLCLHPLPLLVVADVSRDGLALLTRRNEPC